jgi:hypothetical protein
MDTNRVIEVAIHTHPSETIFFQLVFETEDKVQHHVAVLPQDLAIFFRGEEFLTLEYTDAMRRLNELVLELYPSSKREGS